MKAYDLIKLGRPRDALAAANRALNLQDAFNYNALAAAAHFELDEYEQAAQKGQRAVTHMNARDLRNPNSGLVVLVWAAAEAKRSGADHAKRALATLHEAVPNFDTITAIKAGMPPAAILAGYPPLFDALRRSGVPA